MNQLSLTKDVVGFGTLGSHPTMPKKNPRHWTKRALQGWSMTHLNIKNLNNHNHNNASYWP